MFKMSVLPEIDLPDKKPTEHIYFEKGDVLSLIEKEEEARQERVRTKLACELIATEKAYIGHLDLIIKWFIEPLEANQLLNENVVTNVFGNIRSIRSVNQALLEYLEKFSIGSAFIKLGPYLKLYSAYAKNFQHAASALQDCEQKNRQFRLFKEKQESRPEVKGLKLNALLITPIQRIPRYKLLLEELKQNTKPNQDDYTSLTEAVHNVTEIATHINEHVRDHENFLKCLSIQNILGEDGPKIVAPGRKFIKEGQLLKVSRTRGTRSHMRMFFLFNDMLIYAKPRPLSMCETMSYACCCIYPLNHCSVHTVFGETNSKGALFTISCKEDVLYLYSESQEEVRSWIETLQQTIQKYKLSRGTLRKDSSNRQPVRRAAIQKMRKESLKQQKKIRSATRTAATAGKGDTPTKDSLYPMRKHLQAIAEAGCITPTRNFFSPSKRQNETGAHVEGTRNDGYQSDNEDSSLQQEKENGMDDAENSMQIELDYVDLAENSAPMPPDPFHQVDADRRQSMTSMQRMIPFCDHGNLQFVRYNSDSSLNEEEEVQLCGKGAIPSFLTKRQKFEKNSSEPNLTQESMDVNGNTSTTSTNSLNNYCTIL